MKNINPIGLAIGFICVTTSLIMSAWVGWNWSDGGWISWVYALLGIAAIAWEIAGATRSAHLWREGRYVALVPNLFGMLVASTVTIGIYELEFIANVLETHISIRAADGGDRASLETARTRLQAQISKAGISRPVAAVQGDLDGVKANPRWYTSKSCTDVTAPESKTLCSRFGELTAELGTATALVASQARIDAINAQLRPLAAAQTSDARSSYLSQTFGTTEKTARIATAWLMIVLLYLGRAWAGFVFADPKIPNSSELLTRSQKPDVAPGRLEVVSARERPSRDALLAPAPLYEPDEADDDDFDAEELQAMWDIEREQEMLASINRGRPDMAEVTGQVAEVADERPMSASERRQRQLIARFMEECLVLRQGDRKAREEAGIVQDAFRQWQSDNEIVDNVDKTKFGVLFTAILEERQIGGKLKSSGQFYWGIQLRPYFAHRLAEGGKAVTSGAAANGRRSVMGDVNRNERAVVLTRSTADTAKAHGWEM